MLVQGQILQGEASTIPVESHHTPTVAPSTSQPHHLPTLRDFINQETEVPRPSSPTQTHVADEAASTSVDVRHGGAATTVSSLDVGQGSGNIDKTPAMPYDSPLPRVHTLGSDEGRMQPNELMELVRKLSDRVAVLENDLKQTKKTYGADFSKLIKKVKTLEKTIKSSKARRRAKFVMIHHDAQTQGRQEYDLEPNFEFTAPEEVYTTEPDISTANVPVSTAGAEVSTAAESLVYIRRSAAKRKDKGKAIVEESEPTQTKTKIQQEQERLGFEEAQRLQEQFDEEERQRIASVHEEASTFKPEEWDNIQAQIEADEELAHRLQAQERERYSEADKAKLLVELINERKRQFAQQRAQQRRNRPLTQAQQRSYMCNYIKHMGSHTLQQLRGYSFDEIKVLFEATVKRVNTFTLMESNDKVPKVIAGSSKRIPKEGMNVEALQTKYPIIDWEVTPKIQENTRKSSEWVIIHRERFSSTEPTDDKEKVLWVELKRLFEPNTDDLLELQRYMHDPLTQRELNTAKDLRLPEEDNDCMKIKTCEEILIMEYLVKISKKVRILELKRRHLKITVLTSYTPYPSRKIRHICACTSQETTKIQRPIRHEMLLPNAFNAMTLQDPTTVSIRDTNALDIREVKLLFPLS
ncbi:hypothetical protein Tco_0892281 [Tanacetum coccineum]|uniref:Uncharacterized protein n=1 Tax=Tanacetum coccineum TaxID=301880 RepID=A0ABQ5CBI1_9ASTR